MLDLDRIHCGDAVAFMRGLPEGCAPLIIADPPYSVDKDFGIGIRFGDLDSWLSWSKEWLAEAVRILHPQGNIFVYAIHHSACFLQCCLYDLGLAYRRQIIWYYENGWSRYTSGPACHYEPILWFAKSPSSTYHTIREPYKSVARLKHKITKNGKVWTPNPEGRQAGDVWHIPTLAGKRFAPERENHPTQKPLLLCERLVKHFSNPGDLVFVPFAGSGSECVAAARLGRRYLGAELNPEYVKIAQGRLEKETASKS
jgi:DNA modification methylase